MFLAWLFFLTLKSSQDNKKKCAIILNYEIAAIFVFIMNYFATVIKQMKIVTVLYTQQDPTYSKGMNDWLIDANL